MAGRLLASLAVLCGAAPALRAQGTDASIVGRVVAAGENGVPAGAPIADVVVTARNAATGFAATARTNAAGHFALLQLPLGGPYSVTARRIGLRAATRSGYQLTLGARVTADFTLRESPAELAPVVVAERAEGEAREQRVGANFRVSGEQLATIPTRNRSFTDLASLAPTAGAQQALLGQRWTSTDIRLDGLQARNMLRAGEYGDGAAPYTVSMEAIREFEVNSNVYDVTAGRQGGGSIRAATKFGTNTLTGSAFAYRRSSALSAPEDFQGRSRAAREFAVTQWGGSLGGPIVRDRLHFFAAFDRQDSREPLFVADLRAPRDQVAAGIARDSVARLLDILGRQYGLSGSRPQLGTFDRAPVANTLFGRVDWAASARHRLTLRHDFSDFTSPLSGGVDQPIALYEARSGFRSRENQSLFSLRSALARAVQNELRLGLSTSERRLTPVSDLPRGFVRVQSALPDGTTGDVRVQFGGNRLAPDESRETQLQLVDHVFAQRGDVLFTLGTDDALTRLTTYIAEGQTGLFEFESLADLEALHPSRYSRALPLGGGRGPTSRQSVLELGAFAQAEWRPSDRLSVTAGMRWDGTAFLTAAGFNPVLFDSLGLRTDRRPADWSKWQPRAQVVWNPNGDGRDVVRVGGGRFAAQPPYYAQHNTIVNDGMALTDVVATGAAVPAPDYPAYRRDPAAIPGLPAGAPVPPSYVNVVSPGFRTPSVWKGNVSYQRRVREWLTLTGSLIASRTTDNYYYVDRNLRAEPAFTLGDEAGRGVFVPASTIDARGRTLNREAWRTQAVGRVLELVSTGEARQRAVVAEGAVRLPREASLDVAYTYNRSRDNSTYGCCLARTATTFTAVRSDPRDLSGSWGPSDTDFRHKMVVAGALPPLHGFRLSGRYVGSTGRPFSLVVNGDVNGDEATSNDLAFIFDPDDPGTPPEIAASMRRALANPRNLARGYMRRHLGQIAGRNTVSAPWSGRIDMRLSKTLGTFHGQRAELIADVFNFANLLNGSWGGQFVLPAGISNQNPVVQRIPLLNVVGFDQATRRYRYTVNENVGVLQKGGDPYQIQLGIRYDF